MNDDKTMTIGYMDGGKLKAIEFKDKNIYDVITGADNGLISILKYAKFDSNYPCILTQILTTFIPILNGSKWSKMVIFHFYKIEKALKTQYFQDF